MWDAAVNPLLEACRMPTKGYSFTTWLRIDEASHPQSTHSGAIMGDSGHPEAGAGTPRHLEAAAEPDRALYSLLSRDAGGVKGICALLRSES
jgi:hypothetical protein